MRIVGLVSCYLEGRLTRAAIQSLLAVEPDDLLIYEGPAGEPIEHADDCPPTWLPREFSTAIVRHSRWRSDARKRQAMLEHAKRLHPELGPLWGVWLDGDEILVNGEYLRDLLQQLEWQEEAGGDVWARYPLRLIEADGSMALITGRVVRLDLIREYRISTSVIENTAGIEDRGYGNVPVPSNVWLEHFLGAVDRGRMVAWPPLPCEPHIFHRSHLRHPARRGHRLHEQEAAELRRAGL